jgi:hypothetical protein
MAICYCRLRSALAFAFAFHQAPQAVLCPPLGLPPSGKLPAAKDRAVGGGLPQVRNTCGTHGSIQWCAARKTRLTCCCVAFREFLGKEFQRAIELLPLVPEVAPQIADVLDPRIEILQRPRVRRNILLELLGS